VAAYFHVFLALALDRSERSVSRYSIFSPSERPTNTQWTGRWVDLTHSLSLSLSLSLSPPAMGIEFHFLGCPFYTLQHCHY
jgi:hypothetical protein